MKTAFLFPGQGSQVAGMGKDIAEAYPAAAEIFDKANQVVGYDLKDLCFEGPAEKLNSTIYSQPAIFTTSAAMLAVMNSQSSSIKPDITAGLSLGEYTALYAAGVVSFEEGLMLVQKRGQAMQQAAEASDGSMVSIIGLDEDKVQELCMKAAGDGLCKAVNFNCRGQIVVSGDTQACRRAAEMASEFGAIKAVELAVAGAFHTEMMQPAAEALGKALGDCTIASPSEVGVIANIDAEYYEDAEEIRQGLVKQLIQPILWQKCMERLISDGVEEFYEIGPGRVLTGLMKRIDRKQKTVNISNLSSLQDLSG